MAIKDDSFSIEQLASALDDPAVSTAEIVRIIERDRNVATYVVRLANSAYFAGRGRVQSVRDAVVRLGTRNLRDVVFDAAA